MAKFYTYTKLTILLVIILGMSFYLNPGTGAEITDATMNTFDYSANYSNGRFNNLEETPMMHEDAQTFKTMFEFLKKGNNRSPKKTITTRYFNKEAFMRKSEDIHVSWFGHSTTLLNIDGLIVLTDPFFEKRASPISFIGSKKFDYSIDHQIEDLPPIDVVLISHDHYDHLDYKTIKKLKSKVQKFIVPLGVAAHLIKWGVNKKKIVELDWWNNHEVNNISTITVTPARHFSGRALKRNSTLWCSFVIEVNKHKVYFSGDSGYGDHFKEIGQKFGSFDLTLMECGQYHQDWRYIHMNPEETLKANSDLNGAKMIPLHWGKLALSLHSWTEPVDELLKHNHSKQTTIIIPQIGEIVVMDKQYINSFWWR